MAEQYLTKAGLAYFYSKLNIKAGSVDFQYNTVAGWNSQYSLIAQRNIVYVYTDYQTMVDGQGRTQYIPGFKIGDGLAYLIDLPIVAGNSEMLNAHINDTDVHVRSGERSFWNNKVTCYVSSQNSETLVFTTST